METIHIPQPIYDAMVAHAREGFPNEICGVVIGSPDEMLKEHRAALGAAQKTREALLQLRRLVDGQSETHSNSKSHKKHRATLNAALKKQEALLQLIQSAYNLGWKPGEMRELHRATNIVSDPLYTYDMDGNELRLLNQLADDREWEFSVIYHSHPPFAEVYPSATDIAKAFYPDAVYIILAIGQVSRQFRDNLRDLAKRASIVATWGDPQTLTPRMRAYRIIKEDWSSKEGRIEELKIEVVE